MLLAAKKMYGSPIYQKTITINNTNIHSPYFLHSQDNDSHKKTYDERNVTISDDISSFITNLLKSSNMFIGEESIFRIQDFYFTETTVGTLEATSFSYLIDSFDYFNTCHFIISNWNTILQGKLESFEGLRSKLHIDFLAIEINNCQVKFKIFYKLDMRFESAQYMLTDRCFEVTLHKGLYDLIKTYTKQTTEHIYVVNTYSLTTESLRNAFSEHITSVIGNEHCRLINKSKKTANDIYDNILKNKHSTTQKAVLDLLEKKFKNEE